MAADQKGEHKEKIEIIFCGSCKQTSSGTSSYLEEPYLQHRHCYGDTIKHLFKIEKEKKNLH